MDRLQAIKVAISIADHGGLSAAARALGMSTPAVVRALAALQLKLGVRLFNRTTRQVALTPEGISYLATVRPLLLALDAADVDVRDASGAPAGDLVITAPVLLGQQYVGPIATAFAAANPGVRCELRLDDGLVDLVQDGIDLGVRIGRLGDSSLVAVPLTTMRQVVVASPQSLIGTERPHTRQTCSLCLCGDLAQCTSSGFSGSTMIDCRSGCRGASPSIMSRPQFSPAWPARVSASSTPIKWPITYAPGRLRWYSSSTSWSRCLCLCRSSTLTRATFRVAVDCSLRR